MLGRVPFPARSILRCAIAAAAIAFISACGGGGSGGSGGPGPSGPTGFIPAAGTPGPTLYARGTDVRPVRAGAKWVYHSHDFVFGGGMDYATTAVAGASANQVLETTSDDPAGATTVTAETDGSVRVSAPISFGGTSLFTINGFELRSPVRVNDQYVLYDGNVSNIDADGDGRADVVKVAYWRVVAGDEPVSLPNRAAPTSALRVDSFIAVEVTPSSGGGAVRVDLTTSAWYEPGVGMVRLTLPSTAPGRAWDLEEVLTGWDGVTEGRGYITQPHQYIDAMLNPLRSAGTGVELADGVLVSTGSGLHRLDRNGVFQATLPNPPIDPGYQLLRSSSGIQAISGFWPAMQLHAFNDQGQYLASTGSFDFSNGRPNTLSDTSPTFGSHAGNPWLWVAWKRNYVFAPGQGRDEIVLRAVAPDGSSGLPELVFPVAASSFVNAIRVTADTGSALLVWNEQDTSSVTTVRTARIGNAGNVVFDTSPVVVPGQFPGSLGNVLPMTDGSTTWLYWQIGRPTATPGTLMPDPHGVLLDATGQPVGDPAAASLLPTVDPGFVDWYAGPVAGDGHLFAFGAAFGLAFPNDTVAMNQMTFVDYAAGAGPLASTITKSATYRIPGVDVNPSLAPFVFPDRVLILSQSGGYFLRPTVIWR
jgi:hypothetical protein